VQGFNFDINPQCHVFEILKLKNHQFWFLEEKCKIKEPLVHALAKLKEVPEPKFLKDLSKEPLVHALAKLKEVPEPNFMKDLSKSPLVHALAKLKEVPEPDFMKDLSKSPLVHALAKLKEVPEPNFMKDLSKNHRILCQWFGADSDIPSNAPN
jgi:hypothetical protein